MVRVYYVSDAERSMMLPRRRDGEMNLVLIEHGTVDAEWRAVRRVLERIGEMLEASLGGS